MRPNGITHSTWFNCLLLTSGFQYSARVSATFLQTILKFTIIISFIFPVWLLFRTSNYYWTHILILIMQMNTEKILQVGLDFYFFKWFKTYFPFLIIKTQFLDNQYSLFLCGHVIWIDILFLSQASQTYLAWNLSINSFSMTRTKINGFLKHSHILDMSFCSKFQLENSNRCLSFYCVM